MFYLIIFLLVGLNAAPFISMALPKIDIWTMQGLWVHSNITLMLIWSFFEKPKKQLVKNVPLGLMFGWISLSAFWMIFSVISGGLMVKWLKVFNSAEFSIVDYQYYLKVMKVSLNFVYGLAPFVNFLNLLLLYKIIIQYISRRQIEKILVILKYTIVATLFICVLQRFDISQFFVLIGEIAKNKNYLAFHNNLVTGFLGNGTHLSGFLASCVPLFFIQLKRNDILALILLFIILFYCSTTIGDPSISGFIILWFLTVYFFKNKFWFVFSFLVLTGILIIGLFPYLPKEFLSFHGRLRFITMFWPIFKDKAITGAGIGTINIISRVMPYPKPRHLHLEYWHFMVEMGIVWGILALNLILNFFRKIAKDKLELTLKACVLGFLISCLFNYSAHLWLPAVWATAFYSFFIRLKEDKYVKS